MNIQPSPKSLRLHIGIFGRRNVGKSSLLNALVGHHVSIVSAQAGTTTDPVEKPMELSHLGPVVFIDTAGMDDSGDIGDQRKERSKATLDRVDVAILVALADDWTSFEDAMLQEFDRRGIQTLVVFNKCDMLPTPTTGHSEVRSLNCPTVSCSATTGEGIDELRAALLSLPRCDYFENRYLAQDLLRQGETALLVVPIDAQAPKGRLILPQVMTIRDLLDGGAIPVVCQIEQIQSVLRSLTQPPAIAITDSQAFAEVSKAVPESVPMTSFSILMARFQGGLDDMVRGTRAIAGLKGGDSVLVAETCSHHPTADDIGRVKIPNWLNKHVGAPLNFVHISGRDFPQDLSQYKLVVHCGNCTGNRREMLARIHKCHCAGVPITNYGLTIAYSLGIFERALAPISKNK